MKEETCILCRRPAALGLHIMGCMICFSCEKRLVHGAVPPPCRRRLMKLYRPTRKNRPCVFPGSAV